MLHQVFTVSTWLTGLGLGAGGLVLIAALIYLGPVAVLAIVQPIVVRFLACATCVGTVLIVLLTLAAYWAGHHEAEKECHEADIKAAAAATLRNKQIDVDAAKAAQADADSRATTIEAQANDRHTKDLADIAALKARNPTCAFDHVDAGGVPDDKPHTGTAGAHPAAHSP